jgi:hypothetical protein
MTPKANDVPTLRLSAPDPKTADSGKVRYGCCAVTAGTPCWSAADPKTADSGTVRHGDVMLAAGLPPLR